MKCEYGGEVTFTLCEPGYRLRILNDRTVSVILSAADVRMLQARIQAVLDEEETDAHTEV